MRFFIFPKKTTSFAVCLLVLLVLGVSPAVAESANCSKKLSAAALEKGYTLRCPGVARLGLPASVDAEVGVVTITATDDFSGLAALPSGTKAASALLAITAVSPDEDAHAVVWQGPFPVILDVSGDDEWAKDLYLYDPTKQIWEKIESRWDKSGRQVKAMLPTLPVQIAVVTSSGKQEGVASWYGSRRADDAASNDFPMGTKLRVHNLENKKFVDVVVRSTGPFVPGRVIDLSSKAFAKIQAKWKGVAQVMVEKL